MFLAKAGIPTLVLEKAAFPRDKICGDALSGKVVQTLKRINPVMADKLELFPKQVPSWGVTFVAPNGKALKVPFKQDRQAHDRAPGYISRRIDFDDFLFRQAQQLTDIDIWQGFDAQEYTKTPTGYSITAKDGRVVEAELLLVADGAQSRFARQVAGIQKEPEHYCAGIRAYYTGVKGLDADGFIELHFIKELLPGYFWIFPLPDGSANVGLGVRSDVVSKRKLNLKQLLPEIVDRYPALKQRFAQATLEGPIAGFGLPLGSKKRVISGDNYMLLGDAASLIDPFTGEGIGNAMICGQKAAEITVQALEEGILSAERLRAYDEAVYKRMWNELALSRRMQELVRYPWLFNLVVNKAEKSATLRDTISCMFEDLEVRNRLKQPGFYVNLLLNK